MTTTIKSHRQLRKETDERFKEYSKLNREVKKLDKEMADAKKRKAHGEMDRIDSKLSVARSRRDASEREYEEAQRAELGSWMPKSMIEPENLESSKVDE